MGLRTSLPQSSLFVLPLIPSIICMILSLCGTAVMDVSDYSSCSDSKGESLQAFVVGCIVLGYLYSFYHGFSLVGPDWLSNIVSVMAYLVHALVLFGYCIFGSVAVAGVSSDCTKTALYGMANTFLPIYFLLSLLHITLGVMGFVQGQISADGGVDKATSETTHQSPDKKSP
uniref:Uncharacterized protein n=1 Tax=Lotharella oceanica TaxID=641309 RepID=A0A7S2TKA1_9EUKA|mmetsp:Transcript_18036/g.34200  ORF Transcript_18036/g.34200 Transcript_18036/m.34200 type:complete len:172 (+) Transcript_18036:46-561(+)